MAYSPYARGTLESEPATWRSDQTHILVHVIHHLVEVHLLELAHERADYRPVETILDLVQRGNRAGKSVLRGVGLIDLEPGEPRSPVKGWTYQIKVRHDHLGVLFEQSHVPTRHLPLRTIPRIWDRDPRQSIRLCPSVQARNPLGSCKQRSNGVMYVYRVHPQVWVVEEFHFFFTVGESAMSTTIQSDLPVLVDVPDNETPQDLTLVAVALAVDLPYTKDDQGQRLLRANRTNGFVPPSTSHAIRSHPPFRVVSEETLLLLVVAKGLWVSRG